MQRLPAAAALLAFLLLGAEAAPVRAQCGNAPSANGPGDVPAYQRWCEACGGTFSYNGSMSSLRCDRGPNWGRATGAASAGSAANSAIYQASYQLGYAFGRWLFGSRSNPQEELRKRLMFEELRRRQAEADRQRQDEQARWLAAVYDRLAGTLKLSGVPALEYKGLSNEPPALKLKLGDAAASQLSAPSTAGGAASSPLQLKLGDQAVAPIALQAFDPANMTPQQLADVAQFVGQLPSEELQRLLAVAQQDVTAAQPGTPGPAALGQPEAFGSPPGATEARAAPPATVADPASSAGAQTGGAQPLNQPGTSAIAALRQQAGDSQAATTAATADDASGKARAGFDKPLGPGPVQTGSGTTPTLLRDPGTPDRRALPPLPEPPTPGAERPAPLPLPGTTDFLTFMFPPAESKWRLSKNPSAPLGNPLRNEQALKAELRAWDDWAVLRGSHYYDVPDDPLYPVDMERMELHGGTVREYAPELAERFARDREFRADVCRRLQAAADKVAPAYYQAQAEVYKAGVLAREAEMEKLAAAGRIEKLAPLDDQFRRYPERRAIVQEALDRLEARERAALDKAAERFGPLIEKELQTALQALRRPVR